MRVRPMFWLILFLVLFVLPHVWTAGLVYGGSFQHWSQARWDSSGLAPDPLATPEPVVQVYAARAWGWKGVFAVHSWIVTKRANAPAFERYEVVGWGVRRGAPGGAPQHARDRRPLGRQPAGAPARPARPRGRGADRPDRRRDHELSLSRQVPHLARPEFQHFHRPHRPRCARARSRAAADRNRQGLPEQRQPVRAAPRAAPAIRCRCSACSACPWPARKAWRSTCSVSPSASIRSTSRSSCRASGVSVRPDPIQIGATSAWPERA